MSKFRKGILIAGLIIVAFVGLGSYYFFSMIGKPMYESGMVRNEVNLSAPLVPPAQNPNEVNFWQVENDVKLHHFTEGSGKPILVLHGGPGYPFSEAPAGFSALRDEYQFVYYDQRGSGKSTRPFDAFPDASFYQNLKALEKKLGLGAQIADIERIRQILNVEKVSIIGHSFGALIATLYAAEFPSHVESLVLVSPADLLLMPNPEGDLYAQVEALLPEGMKAEFVEYQQKFMDFANVFELSEQEIIDLNDEFGKFYEAAAKNKGTPLPEFSSWSRSGGWMVMAMFFSIGEKNDYRPLLKTIDVPVLVVHGAKDLQPQSASDMYVNAFPNAELTVIDDAGHFSFVEKPQEFADALREFYKRVDER